MVIHNTMPGRSPRHQLLPFPYVGCSVVAWLIDFVNLTWPLSIISFGPTLALIVHPPHYNSEELLSFLLLPTLQRSSEAVRFCTGLDDMRTVGDSVQQRFAQSCIGEDLRPLRKR